jgi:hypothetical protein
MGAAGWVGMPGSQLLPVPAVRVYTVRSGDVVTCTRHVHMQQATGM